MPGRILHYTPAQTLFRSLGRPKPFRRALRRRVEAQAENWFDGWAKKQRMRNEGLTVVVDVAHPNLPHSSFANWSV